MRLIPLKSALDLEKEWQRRQLRQRNSALLALYLAAGALCLYIGYVAAVGAGSAERNLWRQGQDASMGL